MANVPPLTLIQCCSGRTKGELIMSDVRFGTGFISLIEWHNLEQFDPP